MCEDIQYFYTKKSLNNYIDLYVDPPYWVENLYTNKKFMWVLMDRAMSVRQMKLKTI